MTSTGGETADQVVHMMLSGAEIALRMSGSALKTVGAMALALARNHKKLSGKTRMRKMLKQTRDLRTFPMNREQFRRFRRHAKKYKLLYASVHDTNGGGTIDVILPTTEVNRALPVFEKIKYIQKEDKEQAAPEKDHRDTNEKNADRSEPDLKDSSSRTFSSRETITRRSNGTERVPVLARLNAYRDHSDPQKAPNREKETMAKRATARKTSKTR